MKAVAVTEPPEGDWLCEVKFDGYRAIAVLNGNDVQLWSRNHKNLTAQYPEAAAELAKIACQRAVLDGEIVALDAEGKSRFQLLQGAGDGRRPPIVYYVFDLLQLDGENWMDAPLEQRRDKLGTLIPDRLSHLKFSPGFRVNVAAMLEQARRTGLEGIIAKRPGSPYLPGVRSDTWLKCKVVNEQEFVIGGFTPPRNSRSHFGSLLIGYFEGRRLMYAGKVGTGFDQRGLKELHRRMLPLRVEHCPFANLPLPGRPRFGSGMTRHAMREVTWIAPRLVAQIRFAEWTQDGLLRQPVFLGLREDKAAKAVRRETTSVAAR